MKFAKHGIPFEISETQPGDLDDEAKTLAELLDTADPAAIAELQWRLSVPITLLVLTLIAVPLSRAPPRQGRYNNLILGVLIYIIYSNMLGASKAWVANESISPWVGLWWVHGLFIFYGVMMLMRQNGIFRQLMARRAGAKAT
jgi:lipopolysaccharide export system permease protein